MNIPYITVDQMREVDRLMIEEFDISLEMMMEQAGRHLADVVHTQFMNSAGVGKVVVLVGGGNNGGGGLVGARYLQQHGYAVEVVMLVNENKMKPVPQLQLQKLSGLTGVSVTDWDPTLDIEADVIVDAMIGYGFTGELREPFLSAVRFVNSHEKPVVALDIPSGLVVDAPSESKDIIQANATVTLALPKQPLEKQRAYIGIVYLADIGVPAALYAQMGLEVPDLFVNGHTFVLE